MSKKNIKTDFDFTEKELKEKLTNEDILIRAILDSDVTLTKKLIDSKYIEYSDLIQIQKQLKSSQNDPWLKYYFKGINKLLERIEKPFIEVEIIELTKPNNIDYIDNLTIIKFLLSLLIYTFFIFYFINLGFELHILFISLTFMLIFVVSKMQSQKLESN